MQQLAEVREAAAQGPPDGILDAMDSIRPRFPNSTP